MQQNKFNLFALGFRPFYLLAASWGIFAIGEWLLEMQGQGLRPSGTIIGMQWHAHEMIFGFATTVVTGFSLTAVRAWTGLDTPKGLSLFLLTLLWVGGRIGAFIGTSLIVLDVIFLPVIAITIGRLLLTRKMYRNLFLPIILTVLGILNGLFYLADFGYLNLDPNKILFSCLYMIIMIETIIGNRVIPSFTANAIVGLKQYKNASLTRLTIIGGALTLLMQNIESSGVIIVLASFSTALLYLLLLWGWRPLATIGKPILWILHLSYAWIPVGFILLGLSHLGLMTIYPALHVFGIGATSGLIMGMITRTALGHTGRQLTTGFIENTSYLCIQVTLIFWLIANIGNNPWFYDLLIVAGLFWATAFSLYLFKYIPLLVKPRPDGKPG